MRLQILIALLVTTAVFAADYPAVPGSFPRLHIKSVNQPQDRSQPLQITLELAAGGKLPVVVVQEQFSVVISTDRQPWLYTDTVSFAANAPRVFTASPQEPVNLVMTTVNKGDGVGGYERWSQLPPGTYTLRVYIGGKDRKYPYQWAGQTYSDDYKLVIQ